MKKRGINWDIMIVAVILFIMFFVVLMIITRKALS